jgi:hypothetical protein
MNPEDEEFVTPWEEDRRRDEKDEYDLRTHYAHLEEEEEKKKERIRREEEDYNEFLLESHLRHEEEKKKAKEEQIRREGEEFSKWLLEEEEKKRAGKDVSSPPFICNSCNNKPAKFKLTTVDYRSGCTCAAPVSHVGEVTYYCAFECSYWDLDERYTERGLSFVVMGGENECNLCGMPTMSTVTYMLKELNAVTSSCAETTSGGGKL